MGDKNLSYKLNTQNCPANIGIILNAATALWNSVATSKLSVNMNGSSNTTPAVLAALSAPDSPVIVCDPAFQTTTGEDPNTVVAVGFIGIQTNPINYGGIILNVQPGALNNINNLSITLAEITIAHEMGHSLGLGHSADPSALMYWNAGAKTNLALAQDDIDGITYLYPRNEIGGDGIMGCGMISNNSKKNREGLWPIWIFLFLPLILITALKAKVWARPQGQDLPSEKDSAQPS